MCIRDSYGVKLGRAFFGESMFSRTSDASKVALAWLVARLKVGGYTLFDCQFMTDHLASLGALAVSRDLYVELLTAALGGAEAGSDSGSGSGSVAGELAAGDSPSGDLWALDRLLAGLGCDGADPAAGGPAGKVIAQLLGHTS